jgi:dihydroorotate dehydrogenase (NAD+) catalytic subunit
MTMNVFIMDFSTKLARLNLANPLVAAAGPNGRTGKSLKRQAEGGAGAVVTKSIAMQPIPLSSLPCPRLVRIKGGLLLTDLHSDKDLRQWEKEIKIAKEGGVPVIASIQSLSRDPVDDIVTMAPTLEEAGADAIELAAFGLCSNVATFSGIGPVQDPKRTLLVTKTAKRVVRVPVITKLAPELSNFIDLLKATEEGGADAIAMRDTLVPAISFDLKTGDPLVTRYAGVSWLPEIGGTAVGPSAMGYVLEAARRVKLPIVGIGGVSSWEDAIEMIMAGAECVGICTASITTGPTVFKRIMKGIETYLLDNDFESLDDVRGLGLRRLEETWASKQPHLSCASIDQEKCTGCGLCESVCLYDAVTMIDRKAEVKADKCTGCGLCKSICPANAIELTPPKRKSPN